MEAYDWIEKYPSVKKFKRLVDRGRLALDTVESYVKSIRSFCEFLGFNNPEEALEHVKTIEDKTEWLDDLVDQLSEKFGKNRCNTILKGVKRWFGLNRIDVSWEEIILPSYMRKISDRSPTKEELKRLLAVSGIRERALILVAVSSGLRANTLRTLTFGDVDFDSFPDIAKITVHRTYKENGEVKTTGIKITRSKKSFITFISPEAKKALLDYKAYREELGETVTDTSPLFTSKQTKRRGKMLNRVYFSVYWGRLLKRAHLEKKSGSWHVLHFHTLRKFFNSSCVISGVKDHFREAWLGHRGLYLDESYFKAEEKEHVKEYRKAINALSVIEAPEVSETSIDLQLAGLQIQMRGKTESEKREILLSFLKLLTPETRQAIETKMKTYGLDVVLEKENKNCEDGNCQKIIEESQLKEYLAKGYRFVSVLPSGKVVVED